MYTYTYAHTQTLPHTHTHACTHSYAQSYAYTHIPGGLWYSLENGESLTLGASKHHDAVYRVGMYYICVWVTHTHTHAQTHTRTHPQMYIRVYVYTRVYTHTQIRKYTCIYIHTHVCQLTHTHMEHAIVYTYINVRSIYVFTIVCVSEYVSLLDTM